MIHILIKMICRNVIDLKSKQFGNNIQTLVSVLLFVFQIVEKLAPLIFSKLHFGYFSCLGVVFLCCPVSLISRVSV